MIDLLKAIFKYTSLALSGIFLISIVFGVIMVKGFQISEALLPKKILVWFEPFNSIKMFLLGLVGFGILAIFICSIYLIIYLIANQ